MTDPMLRALPDDVADLLALERDTPVPAGVEDRVLARVEATIAGPPAATPATATAAKPIVAAVAAALLGLGGAATYLSLRSGDDVAARSVPELATTGAAPRVRALRWRTVAPEPSAAQPAPATQRSEVDTLAAERAILDRAQTAILSADGAAALAAVAQHTDRFRRGVLIEEREALRVQALVVAGRAAEARERGARFLSRYPRSIQRGAVRAALESLP